MERIKLFTGEFCYALLGNINTNIASVSFDLIGQNGLNVQFVLINKSEQEEELINDTMAELEAFHGKLDELRWDTFLKDEKRDLLPNVVFQSYRGS